MRQAGLLLLVVLLPAVAPGPGLEPPVRIEAGGKPIDVLGGHAAPAVANLDGDGVRDLLVGQFLGDRRILGEATMRAYRNAGTEAAPRFEGFEDLKGGGSAAWVPSG